MSLGITVVLVQKWLQEHSCPSELCITNIGLMELANVFNSKNV